jgi:ParB-like chromosome segregation protein Spo0J
MKQLKIIKLKIEELLPMAENPNKMSDAKFNTLVKTMEEIGYDQPIKVWWNEEVKKYEIIKGNHRYWGLKTLGETEIDCVIGEYANRDEALRDLVRDNIVKGEIDPVKFTEMYNKLSEKYGEDATKGMFDFIDENEMKRLIKEIKKELPEDLQKKLEEAKEEIKTIDDLSLVLNRIFTEHGDTLPFNLMVFDYLKGGEVFYVRANKENWKQLMEIKQYCVDNKKDVNDVIQIGFNRNIE